jgi:Fe-S-cluster containining protein
LFIYTPGMPAPNSEWFTQPSAHGDGTGLRFSCTMCGNCCSGPEGYVLVTDVEVAALARRKGLPVEAFAAKFTHMTAEGRSLTEHVVTLPGRGEVRDCIFLDRATIPGKAVCGVYEDRPAQCRTWPFWPSVVTSRQTWERAMRICPGIDKGQFYTVSQVRLTRDSYEI